jgi:hypothetical protein
VVTCRSKDYLDTVRPQGGVEVSLRAAAAVQLCPLDADAVRGYLHDDAAGPVARARWAPVLAVLGTDTPAGQALRTPLMVSLARAIYNPRPGELAGILPDPVELCDQTDQKAVESLLLDAFIPAAYRDDPPGRWKAPDAEKWLVFLACYLQFAIFSLNLAWWQLSQTSTAVRVATPGSGYAGLAVILANVARDVTGTTDSFARQVRVPSGISSAASPKAALAVARRTAIVTGALAGVMFGVVFGVVFGLVFGVVFGVVAGIAGGVGGWVAAVAVKNSTAMWLRYGIFRTWLALRGRLPWHLMSFLADAHRRGVLRQAGAVYQFRHIELQHRLAFRHQPEASPWWREVSPSEHKPRGTKE